MLYRFAIPLLWLITAPCPVFATPPDLGERVTVRMHEVPLGDVVRWMAEITGENLIIVDSDAWSKLPVTIVAADPVPIGAVREAVVSALATHGYDLVASGAFVRVARAAEGLGVVPPRDRDLGATEAQVTRILQVHNGQAQDLVKVVDALKGPDAKVAGFGPSNSLIVTDTGRNVRRMQQLVSRLDEAGEQAHLEVLPVVYANARELAALVEDLDVLVDERSNTMFVVADDAGVQSARQIVGALDVDVNEDGEVRVILLENAAASDVSETLEALRR